MGPIATDIAICVPVCAKTNEPIEIPFGMWTRVRARNRMLSGKPDTFKGLGNFGAYSGLL